ncbi:LptF/LptG family permease [Pelagibacterales bacterium SAG-MED24]|nr:LptF/LptG family permease [Pelagibacterales bacterium SAG-MED24]
MFKVYQKYLISNFITKFLFISLIFFSLTIILSLLEELSFFKDYEINFLYPYFLTLLNTPITLFEIFPFIFLLTTQFLFYDLFTTDELNLLKKNGLNNLKIIKILFFLSICIGIFNILIFYNFSSILKFQYSNIKNDLSNDNKYLAMVTDSGLWIKDEIDNKKFIIKSKYIKGNFLAETIINEFNNDFVLLRTIQSKKVDIKNNDWVIYQPKITQKNISKINKESIILSTNFNEEKINNLFSNISTLNLIELFTQKKEFDRLGYSSDEIDIFLLKLFTTPLLYGILTILSSIIMFNFAKNKSQLFHVVIGILMSVMIYYLIFIFSSMGTNGKLPVYLSIFFPLIIISLISSIGLVNINDK